jgi:hypothetical protein
MQELVVPIRISLIIGLLLTKKLLNQGFLLVKLKSSLRKFYGRHHDLIDRYGISVSLMKGYVPLVVTGGQHMRSGRVSNDCSTSGTCRVNLVTHPVISHE